MTIHWNFINYVLGMIYLHESEEQLIARYIGGLQVQIQDSVNLFDHIYVSTAH